MRARSLLSHALILACFAGQALAQSAAPAAAQPARREADARPNVDPEDTRRFGFKDPIARTPGTIRIATYNVENLFDDKDDPALKGSQEDIEMTKPDGQLKAVADAIKAIDADVIALQEIESKEALLWFRDAYLKDLGYAHVASIDAGDERGIEQSVISRFPITAEKSWGNAPLDAVGPAGSPEAGKPLTMHRSPLMVKIEVPTATTGGQPYALTLFVVHQKSGRDYGWLREAESAKFLALIREYQKSNPTSNVVLLGDFNSQPRDASYRTYVTGGLTDVFAREDTGADPRFITHASGRIIDHILVSSTLVPEVVMPSRFVFGTTILPQGADRNAAWTWPGYASDHFPVVVDIRPVDATASDTTDASATRATNPTGTPSN